MSVIVIEHTDAVSRQSIPSYLRVEGTNSAGPARETTHRGELCLNDGRETGTHQGASHAGL